MVDLTTTYLTLQLQHPFMIGASPLARSSSRSAPVVEVSMSMTG